MNVGLITDDALGQDGDVVRWKTTGVGRYTEDLHRGLATAGVSVELIYAEAPGWPLGEAVKHVVTMPRAVRRKAGQFDLIHASSPITALAFAAIRKPKVVTFHDCFSILGNRARASGHTRLLLPLVYRTVAARSDRVIAVSTQTKEELMKDLHVSEDKIVVVNSGIDERFRPLRRGPRRSYHTVGSVGTLLSPRKRLDYLLTAFHLLKAKHPGLRANLVLCGDEGGQAVGLRQLTESLGLCQEVEFAGCVPDERLVETYNSFDVLVLPSDWEGFGFTILEAQRCGVPVIIREDAHIPGEVSVCCLKATSEEDMADKISALLTDDDLRKEVVKEGLEYSRCFTWDRAVQETLRTYEELL